MFTKTIIAASALAAAVSAQGVTAKLTPTAPAPAGCTGTGSGSYNIAVVNVTTAGGMKFKRQSSDSAYPYSGAQVLSFTLTDGVLTDDKGRTGYIAANEQFQFDDPPQTGAIYTAGFSACGNGTLALGGSAVWYECLSGTFYNLYDESQGAQCQEIFIDLLPAAAASSGAAGQSSDGQVTAATSTSAVSQITDGQIQATTPASSLATTSVTKVSQITDGQIQATTAMSSLATTTSAVVSQITDGQIQASSAASSLVSSKTTSSVALVSQITDGQIQATSASVAPYTGAAAIPTAAAQLFLGAAAVAAYVL
jgi:hypothetical protein